MRRTEYCSVDGCGRLVSQNGKCRLHLVNRSGGRPKGGRWLSHRGALTAQMLRERFHYDPVTGIFTRRDTGKPTGTKSSTGYLLITMSGIKLSAHRLAWLYVHGEWPKYEIDHINRIRDDNRLVNLRDVTHAENLRNSPRFDGTSPRPSRPTMPRKFEESRGGIRKRPGRKKWEARYSICGKYFQVGSFETREMAEAALAEAITKARQAAA